MAASHLLVGVLAYAYRRRGRSRGDGVLTSGHVVLARQKLLAVPVAEAADGEEARPRLAREARVAIRLDAEEDDILGDLLSSESGRWGHGSCVWRYALTWYLEIVAAKRGSDGPGGLEPGR